MVMGRKPTDPYMRFWKSVNKNGPKHPTYGRCWVWTKGLINGYGQFNCKLPGNPYAHRISWLLAYGEPPASWVLHKCDNRACVRPSHLFLGDAKDNKIDCVEKNRHAKGEMIHTAKLSEKKVRWIRKMWIEKKYTQVKLAKMLNVNKITVNRVINNYNWKHLVD